MTMTLPPYFAAQFPELQQYWSAIAPTLHRQTVPAKTPLLAEGDVATKLYFVVSGGLRLWHNADGREITLQFFFANQPVASFTSFYLGQPSDSTLESLAPSELVVLQKTDFDRLKREHPALEAGINRWLCQRLITYRQRVYEQLEQTPTGRYQALVADSPEIFDQVPLHEIATYLGMTPVSLSRIRTRLKQQRVTDADD